MQVLVSTGSLAWFPLSTRFAIARAAGVDGLELLLTPRLARRGAGVIRELERQHEVPVRTVHAILRIPFSPPEQLAEDIVESARLAARLERCAALVIHPPSTIHPQARGAQHWFDAVARALDIASESGFRLALENLSCHGQRSSVFDQLEYLLRVAEEWDLHFTFDTAHAASFGWDLLATASAFLPRLANVHLSDAAGRDYAFSLANSLLRDHQLPGHGTLPLVPLLRLLERRRYSGYLTLELSPLAFGFPRPSHVIEQLRAAIAFCRNLRQPSAGERPPGQPQRRHEVG